MSRAKRKTTRKPRQRQPIEEQACPELRSLIKTYEILPRGNWEDALAIKSAHGHESSIAKHVEKVWAECGSGKTTALNAAMSFPARGYADLAAKLALARTQWPLNCEPAAALVAYLQEDVTRLASITPPDSADKELLERVSDCEAAMAIHRALSEQHDAERKAAERAADAAGYHDPQNHSPGDAWRARHDFMERNRPSHSYERWNDSHKEIGRTAKAVFALKPKTIRGAVAKLRIAVKLIYDDDLDTWQGNRDWLAETLADFERLAGSAPTG